jgi:hypothetical protein
MDHRMTIPAFTLTGSAYDLIGTEATGLDSLTLTPNTRGQSVRIGGDLYRPEPVTVTLDPDGQMNGGDGVELLAALDSLDSPLQWNVQVFGGTGFARQGVSFWFDAPLAGSTVYLGDVSPTPQVSPTGITRGPIGFDDITIEGSAVQFRLHGDPIGTPVPLWISGIFGGKPDTVFDGTTYIFGGKP